MILRKRILIVVLAGMVGAALGGLLGNGPLLRYRAAGVLGMELSAAEFKRIAEMAGSATTVTRFLKFAPPSELDDQQPSRLIAEVTHSRWLEPVPRISSADAKKIPELLLRQSEGQAEKERFIFLGVRISAVAATSERAAQDAIWLGSYLKDVAVWSAVGEKIAAWTEESQIFVERARERKLKYQFDIDQAQSRTTALKKIVASYPGYSQQAHSQVVDVRKENERFVSPMAQLVGAESEIIDIQEKIGRLDRTIDQEAFAKTILADFAAVLGTARSGTDALAGLTKVLKSYETEAGTDARQERLSTLAAELSEISTRFLLRTQFIATPSPPTKSERPGPRVLSVLGALLAASLAAAWLWRSVLVIFLKEDSRN